MISYDIAIIGGGVAGLTSALYAARGGKSTVIFESLIPGGKLTSIAWLENYIGFENGIDGFTLAESMKAQALRFGAVIVNDEVQEIDISGTEKKLVTDNGEYFVKSIIVASGSKAKTLGVDNESELIGYGVSHCATCDGMLYRGKTVVVVGGGDTAFSSALYLAGIVNKVYIMHRRDEFRATKILIDRVGDKQNVELITNAKIRRILGSKTDFVQGVEYEKNGELCSLSAEGVFVNIGNVPNTDFLRGIVELDADGYIVVDRRMKTSADGVFAAGDVTASPLRQVITAAANGALAAESAIDYLQ